LPREEKKNLEELQQRWQAEKVSCCHGKKYWDVHPWEQKRIFYNKITVLYIFQ
jgi:hypothetical protein